MSYVQFSKEEASVDKEFKPWISMNLFNILTSKNNKDLNIGKDDVFTLIIKKSIRDSHFSKHLINSPVIKGFKDVLDNCNKGKDISTILIFFSTEKDLEETIAIPINHPENTLPNIIHGTKEELAIIGNILSTIRVEVLSEEVLSWFGKWFKKHLKSKYELTPILKNEKILKIKIPVSSLKNSLKLSDEELKKVTDKELNFYIILFPSKSQLSVDKFSYNEFIISLVNKNTPLNLKINNLTKEETERFNILIRKRFYASLLENEIILYSVYLSITLPYDDPQDVLEKTLNNIRKLFRSEDLLDNSPKSIDGGLF